MASESSSNDIIETLALNANAILAADEVVVKRATAETAYSWVRGFGGSLGMIHDDFDAVADLERALEGRP